MKNDYIWPLESNENPSGISSLHNQPGLAVFYKNEYKHFKRQPKKSKRSTESFISMEAEKQKQTPLNNPTIWK